jgi:hypothetical protein
MALQRIVVALRTAGGDRQRGDFAGSTIAVGGELAGLGGDALAAAARGQDDRLRCELDALAAAVEYRASEIGRASWRERVSTWV